jgi:ribosomal protein S18 acetylase RimI-like enzyme
MKTTIRQLQKEDEPFLWTILYHALFVVPGGQPFPPAIVNEPGVKMYVEAWNPIQDPGFVALVNGTRVGAVWLRKFRPDKRGCGFVNEDTPELTIAVLPGHRGKGIGGQLISHLIEMARHSYSAMSLNVSSMNPARRLYERFGFKVVREEGGSLVMLKQLPPTDSTKQTQQTHASEPD